MQLQDNESVQRWLTFVAGGGIRSEATEILYLHFLGKFSTFCKKTPDQIIAERLEQLKSSDEMDRRKYEEIITAFVAKLEKAGLGRSSAVTGHNVIKSFFKANYAPLISKSPKSWSVKGPKKVPTHKELAEMLAVSPKLRDRLIIMSFAQTGITLEDFVELLTFDVIRKEFEEKTLPMHLAMERSKIKKKYDTFLGSESVALLTEYFPTLPNSNAPLFDCHKRTIQYIVERASKRAVLSPLVSPHGLRAFFSTYMSLSFHQSSTQHIPIVDYWMGHEQPYKGAYMIPPVDIQRQLYREHEWAVSLTSKHDFFSAKT